VWASLLSVYFEVLRLGICQSRSGTVEVRLEVPERAGVGGDGFVCASDLASGRVLEALGESPREFDHRIADRERTTTTRYYSDNIH
jgi:hypothetical protein